MHLSSSMYKAGDLVIITKTPFAASKVKYGDLGIYLREVNKDDVEAISTHPIAHFIYIQSIKNKFYTYEGEFKHA